MKQLMIKKNSLSCLLLWMFFFAAIFVRYVLYIDFPRPILLAIFTIMVVRSNKEEILALSACCIPLYTSMNIYYGIFVCIIVYVIKYGKQMRFGGYENVQ